jgi:hypothetical protein
MKLLEAYIKMNKEKQIKTRFEEVELALGKNRPTLLE